MDNRSQIINRIEECYQAYIGRKSDVLLNFATDTLIEQILNIPCCKAILDDVKRKYPISEDDIRNNQIKDYFVYIDDITRDMGYFISYCLHWLDYVRKMKIVKSPDGYDKECSWLFSNIRGSKDSISLFKTDFIRPILDYIICQMGNEAYILYLLDRYKQRVERFGVILDINTKKELALQKELHLYLFDQGLELYNSANTGKGEIDFVVKCNEAPFIIEVKVYRKRGRKSTYLSQLKKYMEQLPADKGCLYIFTSEDVKFRLKEQDESVQVITVYTGQTTPSNRNTEIMEIE